MYDKKCPVCNKDLHPVMSDKYGGTCSQGCAAMVEVDELYALIKKLEKENEKLKQIYKLAVQIVEEKNGMRNESDNWCLFDAIGEMEEFIEKYNMEVFIEKYKKEDE